MSVSDNSDPPLRQHRLGIIHLLGWMAGVAVVLAIYTNFTDWSAVKPDDAFGMRLSHLALGLCYGTAVAGLGLVLWRRFVVGLPFPAQPGHWLLVLAAAGLVLTGITDWTTRGMQWLGWMGSGWEPRYYAQLALVWFVVFVGSIITLCLGRSPGRWRWLAAAIALLALANSLTSLAAQLVFYSTARPWLPLPLGNWPWYAAHWSRAYGMAFGLLVLLPTAYADRQGRDWLHWVGVGVAFLLGMVELIQVAFVLVHR